MSPEPFDVTNLICRHRVKLWPRNRLRLETNDERIILWLKNIQYIQAWVTFLYVGNISSLCFSWDVNNLTCIAKSENMKARRKHLFACLICFYILADSICGKQKTEIHSACRHWWEPDPLYLWRQNAIGSYWRLLSYMNCPWQKDNMPFIDCNCPYSTGK